MLFLIFSIQLFLDAHILHKLSIFYNLVKVRNNKHHHMTKNCIMFENISKFPLQYCGLKQHASLKIILKIFIIQQYKETI